MLESRIVIIGAGVLGCSAAIALAERGYEVTVVARDLPTDQSQAFASPWAINAWERISYTRFLHLASSLSGVVQNLKWTGYHKKETDNSHIDRSWYNDLIPSHRRLSADELPKGMASGATLDTVSLAPATYLPWLEQEMLRRGVKIQRRNIHSLEEAADIIVDGGVHCVVNATGLGAKSLVGVMDQDVMPIRGQTVLVRAPWITEGLSVDGHDDGTFLYVIPRPDGNVILGGTFGEGSWDLAPDPRTATRILRQAYEALPSLSHGQGWEKIEIVSHNVGLRPSRVGGPRVELERVSLPLRDPLTPKVACTSVKEPRDIGVIHAYGIGPAGYQSSWGIAENVADLADEHFASRRKGGRMSKL